LKKMINRKKRGKKVLSKEKINKNLRRRRRRRNDLTRNDSLSSQSKLNFLVKLRSLSRLHPYITKEK
jgi:hypothetical protein